MKVLIVSYVGGITEEITEVIKLFDRSTDIEIVEDILNAMKKLSQNSYDIMIIDMMVQKDNNFCVGPLLKPALDFLKFAKGSKDINLPDKVFALFDKDETGDKGKHEVLSMGYAISDFTFSSIQWRRELIKYMSSN